MDDTFYPKPTKALTDKRPERPRQLDDGGQSVER